MEAQTVCPPTVTVSNECSSPTRNSSSSPGASARGGSAPQPAAQRVGVVEPVGGLRPGAGRRLGHQREADLGGEGQRLGRLADQPVPGARHARRGQHRLHPRLVAHVARGLDAMPVDAQRLAGLGERHLQLLQRPDQPLAPGRAAGTARPPPRRSAAGRGRRPPASARPGAAASSGGSRSAGDVVITASRTSGSRAAVATNLDVASSRNGATNAATTMSGSYPTCG